MSGIASRHQSSWDWRAAGNFIGGGTGSGMAAISALAIAGGEPVSRPLFLLAAFLIAGGLGLVWLEIGRPWRSLHVFFHPTTSWMTREAMIAPALLLALLAAAWLRSRGLAFAAAVLAMAFLYCQARILHGAKGIPAWREPRLIPLIIATGLAEGGGLLIAIEALTTAPRPFAILMVLVLVSLRWLAWRHYRRGTERRPLPDRAHALLVRLDLPILALGAALPDLLLVAALVLPAYGSPGAAAGGLLALVVGWALKLLLITRAAYNQGFALPHMPARGSGGRHGSAQSERG